MPNHFLKTSTRITLAFTLLLPTLAIIAGCGAPEQGAKQTTQVAAKVNGDEITVHQINNVLERNPNIAPESAAEVKRQILERLVNQQLAVQKSLENKLERSPKVIQAIEAAKAEILARAYLEQIATAIPQPQPWETQKYFAEHPELFAQRRLYEMEEFVFDANDSVSAQLRAQLSDGRSMPEIANWLRSRGVNFVTKDGVRTAEQISLQILASVQAMKNGQMQLLQTGSGRYSLIRVIASTLDPLDEATATPRIQQFLLNQRRSELLTKEMNRLKDLAEIEFVGEFADSAPISDTKVETEANDDDVAK